MSWAARAGAYLLDVVILGIPLYIVDRIVLSPPVTTVSSVCEGGLAVCQQLRFHLGPIVDAATLNLMVTVLYFTLLIGGSSGQTVGMKVARFRIVDADTIDSIGCGRAFVRWLVLSVLFWAFVVPGIINCLSPLWDRRRQAWHDHAARSLALDLRQYQQFTPPSASRH